MVPGRLASIDGEAELILERARHDLTPYKDKRTRTSLLKARLTGMSSRSDAFRHAEGICAIHKNESVLNFELSLQPRTFVT